MRHRRKRLLLATVNARSLASDARLAEFESASSKIKSDIIGVSEVKRSGQGRLDLQSGYSLYYCGNSDGRTHGGVVFYVPTSLVPRIRPFFHSDRILELIIRLPLGHTLRLLQVYAPQSGLGDEQYEDFLALLGRVISDRPNRQLVILGDFNATIGSKEEGEQFIGQHAKGQERNDHGSQLAAFCEEFRLHAANTYFKKRAGRKWTLRCNLGFKKEIDYVLVRNIKAVQDVSVLNAFNINSDHRLLRCRLHLKWLPKKVIPKRGAPVVGLHLLAANASPELLSFQSSGSTEADYDKITNIINRATSAATTYENLPPRVSAKTRLLLALRRHFESTRSTSPRANLEYVQVCKLVRISFKEDLHRRHLMIVENAVQSGRLRQGRQNALYAKKALLLAGEEFAGQDVVEKSAQRIGDFYSELYHSAEGPLQPPAPPIAIHFEKEEVAIALRTCKARAAPGADGVRGSSIRPIANSLAGPVQHLLNSIATTGVVPEKFAFSDTILLFKKGDAAKIENYRPISLLSSLYKAATKVLKNRVQRQCDEAIAIPPEQAGFRKKLSTATQIHALNMMAEKCGEYQLPLYAVFVDFRKAFDTISYNAIWRALRGIGVEEPVVQFIQLLYANSSSAVRVGDIAACFATQRGVRQGDSLSPLLFILVLQSVLNNIDWSNRGFKIGRHRLSYLAYADDIALLAPDASTAQAMLQDLADEALLVGLEINVGKTKWMSNSKDDAAIILNGLPVERVTEFVYLGQLFSWPRDHKKEIVKRISAGRKAYFKYRDFLRSRQVKMGLKRRLIEQCIKPAVLYGCETWALTDAAAETLQRGQRRLERAILEVRLSDEIPSAAIRKRTKLKDWFESARLRKLKFAKSLATTDDDNWAVRLSDWRPTDDYDKAKRPPGRPRMRWTDALANEYYKAPAKDFDYRRVIFL